MLKNLLPKTYLPLLLILSLLPLLDLIHPGLPVTHDGQDHVARIANFYQNLTEGNLIPRWAGNLNWGYGHPILMFLYPLPSYFASLFHILGFSFVDSTKLVFGVGYILSALTMYLWLKEFLPEYSAYFGSLLYIIAPYRFVDLYVRGAIGEHVAFIFPPLILYSLLKLSKTYKFKWTLIGSCSLAGLILSHNAISLMFLPLILIYSLYIFFQSKNKKLFAIRYLLFAILGFSLSAFFWAPAFFEGKYTLREILFKGGEQENFSSIINLLYSPWSYGISGEFSPQIGIINWIFITLSIPIIYYLIKMKKKLLLPALIFFLFYILSVFMIIDASRLIWERITIIQKFQFPWRFLTLSVFCSSVIGAIVTSFAPKKSIIFILIILTSLILLSNKDYWHAKSYLIKPESFYASVYSGTTDTGESAPIWSVRFMEKFPQSKMEVIGGKAQIIEKIRSSTSRIYEINAATKSRIRENTLYFPGWEVYTDAKLADIQFQDPSNRGLITFFVDKGKHEVKINFTSTKLRLIADIISLVSLIILLILIFSKKIFKLKYD